MTHAPSVLLLDNDHVLRRATALLLANRGAGVSAAATLEEAIALCRRCAHDVALIDLDPPLPGAAEVLRRLREEALAPRRIVMCSTAPIEAEAMAGDILSKPYPFERLMQIVFGRTPLRSRRLPLRSSRPAAPARRRRRGRPAGDRT